MFTRIADFISRIFRRRQPTEAGWEYDEQDARPTEKKTPTIKKQYMARPTGLRLH